MARSHKTKIVAEQGIQIGTSSTAGYILTATDTSGNVELQAKPAYTYQISNTFAVAGEIKVPSGDTDYIPGFFVSVPANQTAKIAKCKYKINGGTSVAAKLQINGSDATGFTGISVGTTASSTDPSDVNLTDGDYITLVVTAVSGTPLNMSFTVFVEYTVA